MKIPFTNKEIVFRSSGQDGVSAKVERILSDQTLQSRSMPMLLSTVYRCVDLISDSVAILPFETYMIDAQGFKKPHWGHPVYNLLDLEPNENMTRFIFFKTIMSSVLLTGNGYAYIERDTQGTPLQLIYIPSGQIGIEWVRDAEGINRKRYRVSGLDDLVARKVPGLVEPRDMIHILNFSYDGHIGVSTLTHARQTLGIATDSEAHASGFFKAGGNMAGILTVEGTRLSEEQRAQIYKKWEERANPVTGKPNGIVVLEQHQKYQPISISPKDSQLLESRQFNVVDICRFFSVSPVKAFDLSKSSYSTVEATNLEFLTDTVAAVITKIELEVNRKLFLPSDWRKIRAEFNTSALLRADKIAQSNYWQKMFYIGAATPNEIRRETNQTRLEDGDNAFVQVNVQPIRKAVHGEGNQNTGS